MRDVSLVPSVLIDAAELARMLSVSKPSLWRWLSEKKILEPIRLSSQCLRWRRDSVLAWIDAGCPPIDAQTTDGGAGMMRPDSPRCRDGPDCGFTVIGRVKSGHRWARQNRQ